MLWVACGMSLRGMLILIYVKHSKIFSFFFLSQLPMAISGTANNEHVQMQPQIVGDAEKEAFYKMNTKDLLMNYA